MGRFPILQSVYNGIKLTVPLEAVEAHARQADINHGQSVKRLADRGGLSWSELAAVLEDRKWRKMDLDDAHETVMRIVLALPADDAKGEG